MNHPTSGTGPDTAAGTGTDVGTDAWARSGASPAPDGEDATGTGRLLREAFADVAHEVTPPPVPLEAIEQEGRTRRRRRRAAALSTGCGLLLLPLVAVLALRPDGPSSSVRPMAPPNPSASASPTPTRIAAPVGGQVRLVEPGEAVDVGQGTRIWLTKEGKHVDEPKFSDITEFQSVVDGNIDRTRPGALVQEASWGSDYSFLSGLYYGGRTPAVGVRIELYDGRKLDGTVLRLTGNQDWGAWYVLTSLGKGVSHSEHMRGITRKVTLYDKDGGVVASRDFGG